MTEDTYYWIYQHFFARAVLGPGRFLNALALAGTLYVILTRFWAPSRRLAGWLLMPIGRSTLYVFVVHLAFVVAVENLGLVERNNLWLNTLAVTLIILAIGLMVRSRFLMWRRHSREPFRSPTA
jgi:fucose 4-O-acetylase-like acetyltransferase